MLARSLRPFGFASIGLISLLLAADAPEKKPSSYAPVEDVVGQIENYLKQLGNDLAAEADYGEDQQSRVAKDANTVVVLAQVLGNHDQEHARKKSAGAVFTASRELADSVESYADAKEAYTKLQAAWEGSGEAAVSWDPAANLQQLMKQVPIVNNKLRSGVTGRRFDRTIEQNAGLATTLAAIAQASMHDTDYCSGKDEEARWAKICAEMRDAAAAVQTSVRQKDQPAATAALERLVKSCDDCHHDFRD